MTDLVEDKPEDPTGILMAEGDYEVVITDVRLQELFQSKRTGMHYLPVQYHFVVDDIPRIFRTYGFMESGQMAKDSREFWIGRKIKLRVRHIMHGERIYADMRYRGLAE